MNLLQRFCSAVIDASDSWGASMEGVDIRTHRENLYGHPDGIVAARVEGASPRVRVEADGLVRDPFAEDQVCGPVAPTLVTMTSSNSWVRAEAFDRTLEDADRWRGC